MKKGLDEKFKIKDDIDMLDFTLLSPMLLLIFSDLNVYCNQNNLPLTVTNVINEKIPGISVSDTHREGRAVDVSVRGWDAETIKKVEHHFNVKYKSYGTAPTGRPTRVFYFHDGTANHIHIQVRRGV